MTQTILKPLVSEIDNINNNLPKQGVSDAKIGESPVDRCVCVCFCRLFYGSIYITNSSVFWLVCICYEILFLQSCNIHCLQAEKVE